MVIIVFQFALKILLESKIFNQYSNKAIFLSKNFGRFCKSKIANFMCTYFLRYSRSFQIRFSYRGNLFYILNVKAHQVLQISRVTNIQNIYIYLYVCTYKWRKYIYHSIQLIKLSLAFYKQFCKTMGIISIFI